MIDSHRYSLQVTSSAHFMAVLDTSRSQYPTRLPLTPLRLDISLTHIVNSLVLCIDKARLNDFRMRTIRNPHINQGRYSLCWTVLL